MAHLCYDIVFDDGVGGILKLSIDEQIPMGGEADNFTIRCSYDLRYNFQSASNPKYNPWASDSHPDTLLYPPLLMHAFIAASIKTTPFLGQSPSFL